MFWYMGLMLDLASTDWARSLRRKRATSFDGTGLSYEVLGEGDKCILLANGLGGRLYSWVPLIDDLWREYRFIIWDYRGLFDSDTPSHPNRLAVYNHIEDAA